MKITPAPSKRMGFPHLLLAYMHTGKYRWAPQKKNLAIVATLIPKVMQRLFLGECLAVRWLHCSTRMERTDSKAYAADGTCFIELTYTVPGASDMMTASQIKRTAFNLLTFCVNTKNSGGIVKGLGISPKYPWLPIDADNDFRRQRKITDDYTAISATGRMRPINAASS